MDKHCIYCKKASCRITSKTLSIPINDRVRFYRCKSTVQGCVYCGKKMNPTVVHYDSFKANIGVVMNNKGESLSLHKNLWMHIKCSMKFSALVKKFFKKHKQLLIAEEV